MHYNCLIVDDEEELAKMTCEYFELFDVTCAWAVTIQSAEAFLEENQVDLMLLDINLTGESGFALCKKIREKSDIPILFISARQSDEDILAALNIGGDDYIKKPYTLSVLLAKVKALLRRINHVKDRDQSMNFFLEEETMSVYSQGRKIELKAREFQLLKCLYENKNKIVTKEQLFEQVWGDAFYSDGTLNVHIRRLREKLEEDPGNPKLIKTIWGTGYLLEEIL